MLPKLEGLKSTLIKLRINFQKEYGIVYGKASQAENIVLNHKYLDDALAYDALGVSKKLVDSLDQKYTWHHLDDLDENLECTRQLVNSMVHKITYPHVGGPRIFKEFIKNTYK